jgi:MFS superfamily sulfate permease-like transporter
VLVYAAIAEHGIAVLGPIVLLAGVVQLVLAALRLGSWFRAMALPVVHGMLAGIGLLIIIQQLLVLMAADSTGSGPGDLAALPGAVVAAVTGPGGLEHALLAGGLALAVLVVWKRLPAKVRLVPGPLVAVVTATLVAAVAGWDAERIELPGSLLDAVTLPSAGSLGLLGEPAVLGTALALALIASAESLLSAVAVDRMHDGPPTRYNTELAAQGVGNTVTGLLGGLPMTAVIVRSATNVRAGARTKASRVLHGLWLLLAVALLSGVLATVPIAALGAVLIMAGVALLDPAELRRLAAEGRGELLVYGVTVAGVFVLGLLEGVLAGLLLAGIRLLRQLGAVRLERRGAGELVVNGPATFLSVPRLADELASLPAGQDVRVDLRNAPVVDPSAADLLHAWRARQEASGATVVITGDDRFKREAR